MPQDDEWLIRGLREGDAEAARTFYERYGPLLQQLADRNLAPGLRRRVGPESICQSACLTFLRRAQAGEFQLTDSDSLWRLLCAITLTKVREKGRFHRRKKRSIEREQPLDAAANDEREPLGVADPRESPIEAIEFQEQFESLLAKFTEEEQQLVELKLQEHTNEEAATKLGCSERSVRRMLSRIKDRLENAFEAD